MADLYLRQRDILDPVTLRWPITLIGLGGIGSAAALSLVKLGVSELKLWDPDEVELHNIPNQLLYRPSDVGRSKVEAAAGVLLSHSPTLRIAVEGRRFGREDFVEGIVVSGLDSMESRLAVWQAVKLHSQRVALYLDGRLGGEFLELHTIQPDVEKEVGLYEESLFPDTEAVPLPCTARAVIHPAFVLAGLIAGQITRWARGEGYPRKILFDLKTLAFLAQFPSPKIKKERR